MSYDDDQDDIAGFAREVETLTAERDELRGQLDALKQDYDSRTAEALEVERRLAAAQEDTARLEAVKALHTEASCTVTDEDGCQQEGVPCCSACVDEQWPCETLCLATESAAESDAGGGEG